MDEYDEKETRKTLGQWPNTTYLHYVKSVSYILSYLVREPFDSGHLSSRPRNSSQLQLQMKLPSLRAR